MKQTREPGQGQELEEIRNRFRPLQPDQSEEMPVQEPTKTFLISVFID